MTTARASPPSSLVVAATSGALLAGALVASGAPAWLSALLLALLFLLPPAPTTTLPSALTVATSVALLGAHGHTLWRVMASNVVQVPEWDFPVFWIHARLAAHGVDFYDPDAAREVAAAFKASPRFLSQGRFWNPPQSMLLFLPLGWFDDIRRAYTAWYVVQCGALVGSAALLWRHLAPGTGARGLLAVAALTLALPPTLTTFFVGQSNFLVLLLLLLGWRHRERALGGVWLCLGILVKPILLLVVLEPLLRRRKELLAGLLGTFLVMTLLALMAFGPDVMLGYLQRGAGAVPDEMYRMTVNQSLLAVLARAGLVGEGGRPVLSPVFLLCALSLLGLTAWRLRQPPHDDDDTLALALVTSLALLLYPQTLDHYAVLLLVPLVLLWRMHTHATTALALLVLALTTWFPWAGSVPSLFLAFAVAFAGMLWLARLKPTA
ncbi:MAG: glycosyltransferase family 87 protein [Myxococcota bacterium]